VRQRSPAHYKDQGLFTEEASQIIDSDLLDEAEAKAESYVAKHVTATTRAHAPSWEHARAVANLKAEQQVEWLDKARGEDWSARKLQTEIAKAGAQGKTVMRWWLVVECGTEAKRDALGDKLERDGYGVKRQEAMRKVPKPKKVKKGPVTARAKRAQKPSTKRRRA
jgi:hypothetical protein